MARFRSILLSAAICSALVFGLQPAANAGMISTQELLQMQPSHQGLSQVRIDFAQQLMDLGVERQQANQRVATLSDQQVTKISQKMSELPAGAGAGSILLTLFIVFVITDVIGATDIFTFIHPVR